MSHASLLTAAAGAMTGFTAVVVVSRRRGDRVPVAWLAVAIPAVFLGLCSAVEDLPWLYWPTGALMLASVAVQVWPVIRGRQNQRLGPGR